MKVKSEQDFSGCVVFICGMAIIVILALAFLFSAYGAQVKQAQPAPHGGLEKFSIIQDAGVDFRVEHWRDGTVTTNLVKTVQTPFEALHSIDSALRKKIIVDAALANAEGATAEEKLTAAADNAGEVLRTLAARKRAVGAQNDLTPSGDGGIKNQTTQKETKANKLENR